VHAPSGVQAPGKDRDEVAYRVVIGTGDRKFGSLWGRRPRALGEPAPGETRVLAAAADQLGGSLERDRLARDATAAEVSRRSDALKSALLDSVSHDLRTPLASIRAAAGTLMDPEVEWPADQRRSIAASIDREAEWLNRLVTNLLDMSRIEAGELKPNLGVFDLSDIVDRVVTRAWPAGAIERLTVDVPADLPPVLVDEVYIGQVLANSLDNAVKYAGPAAHVAVTARRLGTDLVRVTVEDGGPGVPDEALPRLFEKFYRVPRKGEGSRRGTGIGLSVVRGLVEAMGGQVTARRSALGGLAIDVDLQADAASGRA
jgi:two-component system sensor histidine kinase KdpD